jgi:hypothetical protein
MSARLARMDLCVCLISGGPTAGRLIIQGGDFVGVNKQQEIAKDYFLYNGDIFPSKEFDIEKTIVYPSVYEVIRVIDGVPLFFEEHINRLGSSIELLGHKQPYDNETIKQHILKLLEINKCYNYNIKIIINALDSEKPNLFVVVFYEFEFYVLIIAIFYN